MLNSISNNLKLYRQKRNVSQEDLARKVRVGKSTIEKYETGELIPSSQTILKLSTVLDIPTSELSD